MVETNPRTSKGKQATKIDAVLSNASDTIALAKELAPLIPVPLLGSIFSSAQAIVDAARNVRKNKKDCAELARRVSDLTQDLAKEIHGREEAMDDRLKDSLVPLQRQLVEIQEFVERHTSRKIIMNFVNRGAISTQVTDLLMNLDYMMQRFKTTSNIRMEVQLAEMKGRLVALGEIGPHSKQIEWDGQYRVYRMAELRLLRVLRDLTSTVIKGHAEVSLVECHEAEIDGKTVVVKFYRGSPQAFHRDLAVLKCIQHPNFIQLEGYSKDINLQFQVLKGGFRSSLNCIQSLGLDLRCVEYFRVMAALFRAVLYLNELGLSAKMGDGYIESDDIVLDCHSGEPILGAHTEFGPSAGTWLDPINVDSMLQIFTHSGNVFRNITGEFRTHIERALTTNLSMYNALSNHDSSSSDFEEILHLFAQYLTDTLPSRPSRGLNSRIAQVGMIGCFMGSSSIRWLSNVDTPNWTIHYEGVWPSPDGAYCIPLQGGGCQACSEFSDQSVFGQPMFVKSTMPRVEAYDYLIKFGPALAKNLGVNLEDIFIVEEHAEYFSSYFVADTYDVPHHYTPESDVWPELFFHVLPLPADHSRFPEPWGYYSFDPRPTPPGSQLPLRLCRVDNTEIWYESTFPIRAFTKQVCLVNYVSLAPGEVQILQWIYDNISKELNESATLGEAKFAEAPEIDCYSSYSHLVGDEDGDCLVYGHGMTLCTGCSGSVNFTPRGLRF